MNYSTNQLKHKVQRSKLDFNLGDIVTVYNTVEKQQIYNNFSTETKFEIQKIVPIVGIFIGYRTAQTGITRYGEDGPEFKSTGTFSYLLVVTNPRKNPIKAHIESTL